MFLKYIWFKSTYQHRHNVLHKWILAHLVHVSITLKLQVTGLTVSNVSSVFELPRREKKNVLFFAEIQEVAPKMK